MTISKRLHTLLLKRQFTNIIEKLNSYRVYADPEGQEALASITEKFKNGSIPVKKHIIFNLKSQYHEFLTFQYNQ